LTYNNENETENENEDESIDLNFINESKDECAVRDERLCRGLGVYNLSRKDQPDRLNNILILQVNVRHFSFILASFYSIVFAVFMIFMVDLLLADIYHLSKSQKYSAEEVEDLKTPA
jgi:hypothetical protein